MGAMRMHRTVCHRATIIEVDTSSNRSTFSLVLEHEAALQKLKIHARASFAQRMEYEKCMLFRGTGASSAPSEQAVSRQS
jgi:hypothetical protein